MLFLLQRSGVPPSSGVVLLSRGQPPGVTGKSGWGHRRSLSLLSGCRREKRFRFGEVIITLKKKRGKGEGGREGGREGEPEREGGRESGERQKREEGGDD